MTMERVMSCLLLESRIPRLRSAKPQSTGKHRVPANSGLDVRSGVKLRSLAAHMLRIRLHPRCMRLRRPAPRPTPARLLSSSMPTAQSFPQQQPLTDAELDRLAEFLGRCKGGKAMNLEELDGFFAALVAGPDTVMPREYYPYVFGGTLEETCEFDSLDHVNLILGLLSQHWNTIAGTLYAGEPYLPLLLEDDNGLAPANDWAHGFMRGVELRSEQWAELIGSEEHGGSIIPMFMLHHEHDPVPEMRPEPIEPERREDIIVHMAAGLVQIYRYYLARRQTPMPRRPSSQPTRREAAKVGRNDPCPCGSGRKYKHCHGGGNMH